MKKLKTKSSLEDEWKNIHIESEREFDKQIVYLSAGALVLSVGFVGSTGEVTYKWFLIISWTLFALSLVSNLFSHITARKASKAAIEEGSQEDKKAKKYDNCTSILNRIALWAFLIGLCFFIIFTIINFLQQ